MCETPKSPPGDYNYRPRCDLRVAVVGVKHLNPRQGITTNRPTARSQTSSSWWCETPKSPPGDYNRTQRQSFRNPSLTRQSVKHLNPRQGITTVVIVGAWVWGCVWICVKHLNPRQGITTLATPAVLHAPFFSSVKHLNPRQGITTRHPALATKRRVTH